MAKASQALTLPKPINTISLSLLDEDRIALSDNKGRVTRMVSASETSLGDIGCMAVELLRATPEPGNGKRATVNGGPSKPRVTDDAINDWMLGRNFAFTADDVRKEFGCRMKRVDRLLSGLVGNKEIIGALVGEDMRYTVLAKK